MAFKRSGVRFSYAQQKVAEYSATFFVLGVFLWHNDSASGILAAGEGPRVIWGRSVFKPGTFPMIPPPRIMTLCGYGSPREAFQEIVLLVTAVTTQNVNYTPVGNSFIIC